MGFFFFFLDLPFLLAAISSSLSLSLPLSKKEHTMEHKTHGRRSCWPGS